MNIEILNELIKSGDAHAIKKYLDEYDLHIVDSKIVAKDKNHAKKMYDFWNQRQQAGKIRLNATYGALLNEASRFNDERLGQSTTLSGRSIAKHMNSTVNQIVTGEYDYRGDAIVYADTDSSYFSAYEVLKDNPDFANFDWSKENIIALYDDISEEVNKSFPEFMMKNFNTSRQRGEIIKGGRELVGANALFIKKKKYAILMYDKEGKRLDKGNSPGKLKIMGLDLKRADTPKMMQVFLEKILLDLLIGVSEKEISQQIKEFRKEFVKLNGWEKGTPKKVSNLTDYTERHAAGRNMSLNEALQMKSGQKAKVNLPGHVKAAMNWNHLLDTYGDRYSMRIGDGSKIVVCKLKPNLMKMDAVAYPIDELHIPDWFKALPFNHELMEEVIIDNKVENLLGVLNWDMDATKEKRGDDFFIFS